MTSTRSLRNWTPDTGAWRKNAGIHEGCFSSTARNGLVSIGEHIAQDNPLRARSFLAELRAKARQIGDMPLAFPLVPYSKHASIRRSAYKNYVIFYRVEDERIVIVHLIHGAQDFEALVFPDA